MAFAIMPAVPGQIATGPSGQLLASARDRLWGLLSDRDELWVDNNGILLVRLAQTPRDTRRRRISSMMTNLAGTPLRDGQLETHVDVGAAWAPSFGKSAAPLGGLVEQARLSLRERDLQARPWRLASAPTRARRPQTILQFLIVIVATFALPFALMLLGHLLGIPVAGSLYFLVVAIITTSGILQWIEAIIGLSSRPNPPPSARPAPPASAIIAAYLPNEATTILETLDHFLRQDYAGGLQVILAYNTPSPLAIESELADLAEGNPRLVIVKVPDSHSKAQNVNAALGAVTGEFVGIFDADHHPDPGSFDRASRWLATGVDVVQGHCVVRNGHSSLVPRMAAIEFEQIYAVSHRGRQILHGFGVFGGSNGYWNTQLIRTVRMVSSMLTEDIDSSIRATRAGARIVNDPGLVSRELAPETISALWRQRMRWAQGWAQVTAVHSRVLFMPDELTLHQRIGMFFHLLWRETFPVLSALMWPILAFYFWRDGVIGFQPVSLMFTAVTLASAPIHVLLARRVADPSIAREGRWWALYVAFSIVFYQEFKNIIARIAIVKLIMGERNWVVTPRTTKRTVNKVSAVLATGV